MQREYEVHNFSEGSGARRYEAVYLKDELLVKALVFQRNTARAGGKPLLKWRGFAVAWAPGQQDDWVHLCDLSSHEMVVRDVVPYEATEETWLEAARLDAERLIGRAQPFMKVLTAAPKRSRRAT